MIKPSLADFLKALRTELALGFEGAPSKFVVTVRFVADRDAETGFFLRPVTSADGLNAPVSGEHRMEIEFPGNSAAGGPKEGVSMALRVDAPLESGNLRPGDRQTLRRRLELLLGGPPGFTTGAKAEMLGDLLAEFGRSELLETIRRDWITQFDTGPEASPSVSKPPPSHDIGGPIG